ncbi:MAG: hypothetical protein HQ567_23390 [Candidatus Nealsonbacteria bacterium]|nr:hypothetical protein [Candidatus Nealsonbacteria bacterium]
MADLIYFLLALLIVLSVVTLVGHGIWVLLRLIFCGSRHSASRQRTCVYCGRHTPETLDRCDWCGRDLRSEQANELADLEAVDRQLTRFREKGTIQKAAFDGFRARVQQYRRRLFEPSPQPSPEPRPSAAPIGPFADAEAPIVAELVEEPGPVPPVRTPTSHPAKPPLKRPAAPGRPPSRPKPAVPTFLTTPKPAAEPPATDREHPAPSIPSASQPPSTPQAEPKQPPKPRPPVEPQAPWSPPSQPRPKQPTVKPRPPRKAWAEMLAGFMEERNIRWGELVAGLLIVGSSVALVLSLWEKLNQIPYFPFLIFTTAVSAVFGIGLYSHYRWKLESTSRGLLLVATLLVPLNFLTGGLLKDQWDGLVVVMELAAAGLFAWLIGEAGRVLVPRARWMLVVGVLGSSAAVLVSARWIGAEPDPVWFVAAGCLPVACLAMAVGGYLWKLLGRDELDSASAGGLFALLGTTAFAVLLAIGTLVARHGEIGAALDLLSVPIALAAIPILATGLRAIRGVAGEPKMASYHVAGTAVALVGMVVMIAALVLTWPHPLGLIVVGSINAAALVFVAFHYRMPIFHAGAIACATVVYLTVFHVAYPLSELPLLAGAENLAPKMLELTYDASSGTALVGLFFLFGIAAEGLARVGRRDHGAMYAGGCGVVAVVGLLLVTLHGALGSNTTDVLRAAILYAGYGVGSLALTARWRRAELSYLGLGLLTVAPLWALWWKTQHIGPAWAMVVAGEALLFGVIAAVLHRSSRSEPNEPWTSDAAALQSGSLADLFRVPLLHIAEVLAPAAMVLGVATAWIDRDSIVGGSPIPALTAGLLAVFYLLAAWGYRSHERTWAGSLIVLAGLVHTLTCNYVGVVHQPWLVAFLGHATLAVATCILLDVWARARSGNGLRDQIANVFSRPLADSALLSSVLALPALPFIDWSSTASVALCLFWLAAIWLAIAWRGRDPVLFAAHQVMIAAAAVVATCAWLEPQWWAQFDLGLLHPYSLQAYGIVLGVLSLVWLAARMLLREHEAADELLNPNWPAVDWVLRHVLVWAQLLLVVRYLLPSFAQELLSDQTITARQTAVMLQCGGWGAWLLLGLLAVTLVVALWQRWRGAEIVSSLAVAVTVPGLIAVQWADDLAVASALRWGLSIAFIACSAVVWGRHRLAVWCSGMGMRIDAGSNGPKVARTTLMIATTGVVLALTVVAAMLQFSDEFPSGPLEDSFFWNIGMMICYVIPLLLVLAGMVGHAIRERSAGYAFSAGLVAELIVILGYALAVVTDPNRSFENIGEFVTLVQWATITAAVWAGAWLLIRRRLNVWREEPSSHTARVLMNVQLGMTAAGNLLLLGVALFSLAVLYPWDDPLQWTAAAGSPLGWIALVLAGAAYVLRRGQLSLRPQPQMVGLLGMAVIGLLACTVQWAASTVQWIGPEWGYRTLMLGWAAYSLFTVAAIWWVATLRTLPDAHGPPQALIRAAAVWVRVAGIAAVLLGLKAAMIAAIIDNQWDDLLWSAAAIAVASAAGATMAVWRRREGWAFAAAMGTNLAASLVVWYVQHKDPFGDWWLRLVQANVIASSVVALAWLTVRRRLYQLRELTLRKSPLLAAQTALPVIGNFALLVVPVLWLLFEPYPIGPYKSHFMTQLAEVPGWLGLLLTTAAAAWYLRQAMPAGLTHVLGGLGLGAGVLAACHTPLLVDRPASNLWLEYHTLIVAWTVVGLIVLAVGIAARKLRLTPLGDATTLAPDAGPSRSQLVFPGLLIQGWVTWIGAMVVVLSVAHVAGDSAGVWWYLGAVTAVAAMAGVVAMWLRRASYVYYSGLLINVLGLIAWLAAEQQTFSGLIQANVLCLAVGSCLWSLIEVFHPRGVPHLQSGEDRIAFAHLAARVAVGVLAAVVFYIAMCHALDLRHIEVSIAKLDWLALAATTVAVTICLWDRSSRWALPGLYKLGLLAVGMGLCQRELTGHAFYHAAAIELAAFVLITAVLGRVLPLMGDAWQALRIPSDNRRWPADWFPMVGAAVASVAAILSLWISIDGGAFDRVTHGAVGWLSGRVAGPISVAMLLGAALLVVGRCRGRWRTVWQQGTLVLGLAVMCESGFVWMIPMELNPLLHGTVIVMVAAIVMTLISGLGLRKLAGESSDWVAVGQRITTMFGGIAGVTLVLVLAQELLLYEPDRTIRIAQGTMIAWPAIVVVALALSAMATACIAFAVRSDWDPLNLSENRRQAYVYAAELLAALVGLHLFLTCPTLFERLGIIRRFWMLIVMGSAFLGAGLSELFHRRSLRVLSKPLERTALLLPAAPVLGAVISWFVGQAIGEEKLPAQLAQVYGPYVWFLVGLFYGSLAVMKRSIGLGALAILATNTGLWVLWHQHDLSFLDRPQLWLIPIALVVLVAEYLDRGRLDEMQRTTLRYLALSVIYVSSTMEFLRGVDERSVVLPLVLVGLSVTGVLAGILLRVRSFLYLGVTFLTVVIVRMIFFAAFQQHHIWLFWTCCILLGIAILTMFGIFEKRRNDVLAAIDRFKEWQK